MEVPYERDIEKAQSKSLSSYGSLPAIEELSWWMQAILGIWRIGLFAKWVLYLHP
jgi:hypothetical protein